MSQPTFRDLCSRFREMHPEASASKARREVARLLERERTTPTGVTLPPGVRHLTEWRDPTGDRAVN